MKPKDHYVAIALCVSLIAHGAGMIALTEYEIIVETRAIHQPPFDLGEWLRRHRASGGFAMGSGEEAKPQAVEMAEPKIPPQIEFRELFGERGSMGKALNASPGEILMQGQRSPEEQAALTTHPGPAATDAGRQGQEGSTARPAVDSLGNGLAAAVPLPFGPPVDRDAPFGVPPAPAPPLMPPQRYQATQTDRIGVPTPSPDPSAIKSEVAMDHSPATQPTNLKPTTRPTVLANASPTPSPITDEATTQPVRLAVKEPRPTALPIGQMPTTTQPSAVKLATTKPARELPTMAVASIGEGMPAVAAVAPVAPGAASGSNGGEAGHKSESESDPFSTAEALVYRDGKVVARNGRKVKTVRPKLTDAGRAAAISMDECFVILGVKVDERGEVSAVDILRKSGSNDVDLPCYRAMFYWEFEPSKDQAGRPKPDAFVITIGFQ